LSSEVLYLPMPISAGTLLNLKDCLVFNNEPFPFAFNKYWTSPKVNGLVGVNSMLLKFAKVTFSLVDLFSNNTVRFNLGSLFLIFTMFSKHTTFTCFLFLFLLLIILTHRLLYLILDPQLVIKYLN
jgi:hypothetical protein